MKSLFVAAQFAVALPILLPLVPVVACMYLVSWIDSTGRRPKSA